ncbi:alpha/beta hydrolase family protein [Nocardia sp. NPDC088792]|uniref:alpha/beta hydrolase family protein n=1 Tax=Nocardia sp. NPDC088792 TaxID=3364332 RepID=UPI003814A0C1
MSVSAAGFDNLVVVFGPDAVAHPPTAEELLAQAMTRRGVTGELVRTADTAEFRSAVRAAPTDCVVVPGFSNLPELSGSTVIRVDFDTRALDLAAGVRAHIRGRGLDGLRFAVDSWYFHRAHPATVRPYGEHPWQRIELRIPPGPGPFPVAVLIHGGYWKRWWDSDLMDALAVDLTARGIATCNVEYRRPATHGWAATTMDVTTAFGVLASIPALDLDRIVVFGHSAGGQLALRLGADTARATVRPSLLVSLAGVLDLRIADQRWLGDGAVSAALGHRYSPTSTAAEIYRQSSPAERLPIGIPQLVVCGRDDDPDLREISNHYALRAAAAGDRVQTLEVSGDHWSVIDPDSEIWCRIREYASIP